MQGLLFLSIPDNFITTIYTLRSIQPRGVAAIVLTAMATDNAGCTVLPSVPKPLAPEASHKIWYISLIRYPFKHYRQLPFLNLSCYVILILLNTEQIHITECILNSHELHNQN
jgi:hypothetical protein